ncbi:hypothetical protein MYAER_3936 [Microcystis aeruginosa NIES-2549]|uniref:Uncharacterized protein n=1 Tax=Microcystis aeruginosa NIES-2549 TaxID=1641812 RepID=A0A0F6U6U2_MICAE|nr:hypothetical protein MYAER_3936 [Microcystis aeruginosa NIES-2549]
MVIIKYLIAGVVTSSPDSLEANLFKETVKVIILNPLSICYISGEARGRRQEAKGGINNQFLITEFSISW